jgi:hypothetical protein
MGSSENLQSAQLIDNSMLIVAQQIAYAQNKIDRGFLAGKMLILIQ